jgi:hypothetical protein
VKYEQKDIKILIIPHVGWKKKEASMILSE